MSHSTVLVTLKDAAVIEHGIEEALAKALDKFDENKETPRYVKLTRDQAIEKQRKYFEDYRDGMYAEYLKDPEAYAKNSHAGHMKYISKEFPEEILPKLGDRDFLFAKAVQWESDVDEEGNIHSTCNPDSKWDWYAIGGRWSGSILNTVQDVHHPEKKHSETWTEPAWLERKGGVDYLQKKDLNVCHGTFAFLDADGNWHERGSMGWWGMVSDEKEPDAWGAQLKELIEKVDDEDWLVVVDVHI